MQNRFELKWQPVRRNLADAYVTVNYDKCSNGRQIFVASANERVSVHHTLPPVTSIEVDPDGYAPKLGRNPDLDGSSCHVEMHDEEYDELHASAQRRRSHIGALSQQLCRIALTLFWPSAPRWLGVMLYLLMGWVAIWYTPLILHNAGVAATVLLAVGGALYSIGAVFYGLRWPDPWPRTFGYHEFFHACTAVSAICQYIAMWFAVF